MTNINQIITELKQSIRSTIDLNKDDQIETLRSMIMIFNSKAIQTGVPMVEHIVDVINIYFPHLKDDLNKLLILI